MNRLLSIFVLIISFFTLSGSLMAQDGPKAKKPRLVVVPSDALLNRMQLLDVTDDMGEEGYLANYRKAFLDDDLKGCITKIGEMFNDRGFPLTMLETELRRVQGKDLVIPIDYRLELNYKIDKQGPRKILKFELAAIDVYSSKQVAATSGQSAPAIGETDFNLLQEAVLSQIDKFANDLQTTFEGLAENGRESRLTIQTEEDALTLDDNLTPDQTIAEYVEAWLDKNCVKAAYSVDSQDEQSMQVSQSMMPLFSAVGKPLDANNFYKPLYKSLKEMLAPKGLKVTMRPDAKKSNSLGGTLGDAVINIVPTQQ